MAVPCTSCGLDVISGELTLNLGDPLCPDITESDEVFCGPGGVLSVPREACALPIPLVARNYLIATTLTNPGDVYVMPDTEIATLSTPPNTSTCQIFAVDMFIDYTTTIVLTSCALPQCLPIDCDVPLPPAPVAVIEIHYEWRIDGGPWIGLFSDFIATTGITGTNHHQNFALQLDTNPGDPGHTYDFRSRFLLPANHCGTARLENSTILARSRMIRLTPC